MVKSKASAALPFNVKVRMLDPRKLSVPREWDGPLRQYLDNCRIRGLRPQSIRSFEDRLAHLARRVNVAPFRLSKEQLIAYLASQNWAPETRRSRLQTYRGFWNWAVQAGHTDFDPSADLPRVRPAAPNPRAVPYATYLEALTKADARTRLVLRLAGEVGMRRGEIAVGHSDHLLETNSGPSLLIYGKGGRSRVVPLSMDLAHDIKRQQDGYFFPGKIAGHLSGRRISELAKVLLPPPWTIHKLRHMFATRSFSVNKDLVAVQRMLGHSSITTTTVYVQVDEADLRRIVDEIAVKSFKLSTDNAIRDDANQKICFDLDSISSAEATRLIAILSSKLSRGDTPGLLL